MEDFITSSTNSYMFDQFVYGNHEKMRHPFFNKGDL